MVKNLNFEKILKMCLDIDRPKDNKHNAELRGTDPGANIPKSIFYEEKYDFWPIRTRFHPKFIFIKKNFSNIRFLSFIVTLSLLAKKLGEMCDFWLVRAPFALFKSPTLIKNGNFQK